MTAAAPQPQPLDHAAFERLAAEHGARARRFALAYLGDPELAADAVQEALVRLYERREQYPLAAHFGHYLVKTIARLCIDEQRSRSAHERHGVARTQAFARPEIADPALSAQRREAAELLHKAVRGLPDRERACLLLTVCEGLSYREAADALTLSISDVNNAVYQARTALRDSLGKQLLGERPAGGLST